MPIKIDEIYRGYEISWRETGEQFAALVKTPSNPGRPAVITATVSEGMTVLKERTYRLIDCEIGDDQYSN